MAEYLQRAAELYVSKAPEGSYNTPVTTGANFKKAVNDNPLVKIINPEFRTDQGRAGSEFASAKCNTYWEPPGVSISADADFDLMARLWLRAVGGAITDTTVVSVVAGKHVASMLASSSGLQLPSSTVVCVMTGSSASFLYAGMVVGRAQLSQDGVNVGKCQFDLVGSGKHRKPHAVTSLPSTPTFACLKPYAYLSYDDGSPVDLGAGCTVRGWNVTLDNALAPQNDRCTGDSSQNAGDYTASGGASDAAYLSKLTHGDRTVQAQFTILMDSIAQWTDMCANTALTNMTFGVRGAVLDGTAPTYEYLKLIIPSSYFTVVNQVESNGKAAITCELLPVTSGSSILTVEVVNGTIGTFS